MKLTQLLATATLGMLALSPSVNILPEAQAAPKADAAKEKATPEAALDDLVKRVTPQFAGKVVFKVSPQAKHATIKGAGDKVGITAPSVSECARAYGHYLRHEAHVHLSWNGDNTSAARFVIPKKEITVPDTLPYNYAYNYCTYSYTGAHWNTKRWMRELDLLALNGFKYILVTPGIEKVWQGFLKEMGYPQNKIAAFIPAPAYSAWWNMGNLEGEGGPISQSLIDSEAELGKAIVKRCRQLGMEPVLQGYVGFLPHDFPAGKVKGNIIQQGKWCTYDRPAVLQPTAPDFPKFAAAWYKHLEKVYGYKAKAFGGDLFHEGGNKGGTDLGAAAKAVQGAMLKASPKSLWFIQAWGHNPDAKLLAGTEKDQTVVLLLNKDMTRTVNFNFQGRPHVWCELSNFGGNHGLYGGFSLLENMKGDNGGFSGLGTLSEGIETNPFYYALFTERINNRGSINRSDFIKHYSLNRYGRVDADLTAYLNLLAESVYKPDKIREGCLENIMGSRPGLSVNKVSTWSNPTPYYDPKKVLEAGRHLLAAGQKAGEPLTSLETYRYDLADICRQVLADRARAQLAECKAAYGRKDEEAFKKASTAFLSLIDDAAAILATSKHFLLGAYLQGAKGRGKTAADKALLETTLKRLITTWRRTGSSNLNGYAHREFAEIMATYNRPRWKAYFDSCINTMHNPNCKDHIGNFEEGRTGNNGQIVEYRQERNSKVEKIETDFPTSKTPLMTKPHGDIMNLAQRILAGK